MEIDRLWRLAGVLGVVVAFGCMGKGTDPARDEGEAGDAGVSVGAGDELGEEDGGGDDADSGEPPPETEEEADFRVPRASGRWVYSASEATNSVAVIDSQTLAIDVVGVGRGPTVVAPLAEQGHIAVLDQGSDDVALLTTTETGTTVEVVPTSAGANNIAVTPDGEFAFVYHDVDGPEELGPGSDQEITVIEARTAVTYEMTVGVHPREIVFTSDAAIAYVITDDGVNVLPIDDLAMIGKPDLVPVVSDPGINPDTLEIQVAANEGVALARVEGESELFVTDLASTEQFTLELGGVATDLDIAADGSFAIAMLPSIAGSHFVELTLPLSGTPMLQEHAVGVEYVGLAKLSPDGGTMVLYTTNNPLLGGAPSDPRGDPQAGPVPGGSSTGGSGTSGSGTGGSGTSGLGTGGSGTDTSGSESDTGADTEPPYDDPRLRVTIARRTDAGWDDQVTLFVDRPVTAVGVAPDGSTAMLLHEFDDAVPLAPYSYTLIDLSKDFPVKKLQVVAAEPGPILFTPSGDRAVVLLRDDMMELQRVDLVDLRTFIVEGLGLGSPPEGAGFVDATEKIFISQEHPTGRVTFIDSGGSIETVTGFRLNDAVKD
ncbi:MAG: hypothetical protein JKY37_10860 [Nannocystaceae bacterium]|nr:hypothetical protein [Nannocystaceae bacterium]